MIYTDMCLLMFTVSLAVTVRPKSTEFHARLQFSVLFQGVLLKVPVYILILPASHCIFALKTVQK